MPPAEHQYLRRIIPIELVRCDGAESFLQSGFWGAFKARFGWNARPFLIEWVNGAMKPLLVIRRRLFRGFSFAYIPLGPEVPPDILQTGPDYGKMLQELAELLREELPHDTAFLRFDPPWYVSENKKKEVSSHGDGENSEKHSPGSFRILRERAFEKYHSPDFFFFPKPFVHAGADVQPPDTVLLSLIPEEKALLAGMKSKWRYNIRLAEKKGVRVEQKDEEGLPFFYELLKETARRDGIAIHHFDYYQALFRHKKEYRDGQLDLRLYLAYYQELCLAGIIVLFWKQTATYLYGASSNRYRNYMAPYALQWRAICDARAAGCTTYDFFGIPPSANPRHPMAGLYLFKTGFGGEIIHRPGSWDYPYKRGIAFLFRSLEGVRKNLRRVKKVLRYLRKP
ncbi:MAG: peptidoglycan bridge formation glycyltransferase FemA/FemB family protein [Treponemataceae bacterium]|nr:peptidoglycan bridge formation glycyltransferase FemA/FemB family protein [Treponemataceae bacterium]